MQHSKRQWLKKLIVLGGTALILPNARAGRLLLATPSETEGPFYPVSEQSDKDVDLTQIIGHSQKALGERIHVEGQVVDTLGAPLADALIDLWQANAAGRYRHPRDPNRAPLDPNFQGWAIVKSGQQGEFRITTVMPGAYPASPFWTRPPHIHFKINKPGYRALTTQMYFSGQALNDSDQLLNHKHENERKRMIAALEKQLNGVKSYHYKIVLEKI